MYNSSSEEYMYTTTAYPEGGGGQPIREEPRHTTMAYPESGGGQPIKTQAMGENGGGQRPLPRPQPRPSRRRKPLHRRNSREANYYYGEGNSLHDYLFGDTIKRERPKPRPDLDYDKEVYGHTNKYGDPEGRAYAGGSPTFNESTGRYEDYKGADGTVTKAKQNYNGEGRMAGDVFNQNFQPGPTQDYGGRDVRGKSSSRSQQRRRSKTWNFMR